jgi:hypothetical protein
VQPVDEPKVTSQLIAERHARLLDRLRAAATAANRDPDAFRIVAVTKAHPLATLRSAWEAGLHCFGENRVQEAEDKVAALPEAEWHFVGRLQSNKARRAVALFGTIHSVDTLDIVRRIERIAHDDGKHPRLLLQVNLTGQPQQGGVDPAWLEEQSTAGSELASELADLRHAVPVGLMTIGRYGAAHDAARATFARLRELRDRLAVASGRELPELSMGMTADADAAVAEGATLVRVGTAIFGPRPA